jgi:hypothetical protein
VLSPLELVQVQEPSSVRITRQRGAQLVRHDPFVVGDSIVGEVRRFGSGRVAVPLDDVQRLELRSGDGLKNAGLMIPTIPVSLFLTIMIACARREGCS